MSTVTAPNRSTSFQSNLTGVMAQFPWWLLVILLVDVLLVYSFYNNKVYTDVFNFLKAGILVTLSVTLSAYAIAVCLGLLTGLGLVSQNLIIYNIATLYVQVMRGVPILVTILYVAFVFVPLATEAMNNLGAWLVSLNLLPPDNLLVTIQNRDIPTPIRGIMALALSYGAFSAEIFRAGIQSIGRGQMEAARSLGMNYFQAMRYIILPQAIRRVLPPLGNDFIAMLKESSLISALAVRDITQLGRLHSSATFRYLETYNSVAFMYLTMTILLSLGVRAVERRLKKDG